MTDSPVNLTLMDADEAAAELETLRGQMLGLQEAEAAAKDAYKVAMDEWEKQNAAIVKAKVEAETKAKEAKARAHAVMQRYHALTGKTNFKGAFEIRMKTIHDYDEDTVRDWLLDLVKQLLVVDTGAVSSWIKSLAEEDRSTVFVQIPSVNVFKRPDAAVLSKGLVDPKKTEVKSDAPPKLLEPAGEVVTIYTPTDAEVQAAVASSSAEVKKILSSVPPAKDFDPVGEIPF